MWASLATIKRNYQDRGWSRESRSVVITWEWYTTVFFQNMYGVTRCVEYYPRDSKRRNFKDPESLSHTRLYTHLCIYKYIYIHLCINTYPQNIHTYISVVYRHAHMCICLSVYISKLNTCICR